MLDLLLTVVVSACMLLILSIGLFVYFAAWLRLAHAGESTELYADTFYEEFERQLAILKGEPDPLQDPDWHEKHAKLPEDRQLASSNMGGA